MERVQRRKETRERHPDTERKTQKGKRQRGKERGKKGERDRESYPHTDNTEDRSQERVRNTRPYLQRETETQRHSPTRKKTEYTES